MAILKIITYGHPTLRKKAETVTDFNEKLSAFAEDMLETMEVADGIGLAAPQVNRSIRMIVIGMDLIDETLEPQAFINPEIIQYSDSKTPLDEGCLSIPGIREEVIRPEKIKVRYQDLEGNSHEMEADDLLAKVFQHEIDHLDGIMFTDRISPLKKRLIEPQLKELEQRV